MSELQEEKKRTDWNGKKWRKKKGKGKETKGRVLGMCRLVSW